MQAIKDNAPEMVQNQEKTNTSSDNSEKHVYSVKSTAVVKYSVPKPANFTQLQHNTDLNLPPSNWLTNSTESYGLQRVLYSCKGFTSFRMAHMFPDCVGEVDVVSDAENIKNLLKIPYSKAHISMMVHRVENTLLIDEFDIYKHLLRTAKSEWDWLRKFFIENVESNIVHEERLLFLKSKGLKSLKQKHLVSKFLYHSLVQNESAVEEYITNSEQVQGPLLPEPSSAQKIPVESAFEHKFNRNVVWTFEDIEMLLGTDMPIFGGGKYPCMSLRLSDMKKPINVLTGIDYWLDNLMSNVPEVVMCYHLDGIVKKYELIKTEELPSLRDSKFSPKLIRNVAQSILSFLKSNATKAGHTYWLFKGKNEDVVKLYDLTSLCSNDVDDTEQNPFTVPVAMLLYRVARNMKHSREGTQPGTIRMLLKNCLKLLNEEKYAEIVTSSHYMLSDLYVPADTNPNNPKLESVIEDEKDETADEYWDFQPFADQHDDDASTNDVKTLSLNKDEYKTSENLHYKRPPAIVGTVEERSLNALAHIHAGIHCLQYFKNDENEMQMKEEVNIPMANQDEAIPMPYEKLPQNVAAKGGKKKRNRKKCEDSANNALLRKNQTEAQKLPTWQGHPEGEISWKEHLKTLLYEKLVLIYAILSEDHYGRGNFGSSLRYLGLLVRTLPVMKKLKFSVCTLKKSCMIGRAGDCCMRIVKSWQQIEKFRNQFHSHTVEDLALLEKIEKDEQLYNIEIGKSCTKCVLIYDIRTEEQMLMKAVECYEQAVRMSRSHKLLTRLASCLNEVGSFHLNNAKSNPAEAHVIENCRRAEEYLKKCVEMFEKLKDAPNIALVYSNLGHLHRLVAHAKMRMVEGGALTFSEKYHYNTAFANYNKALQVIGERKHYPNIWDAVKWELSTALFTMATMLHEHPSTENIEEAEKEIFECFQRALKSCVLDENNAKYALYQHRAATIHYRLASIYHKHFWFSTSLSEVNPKHFVSLAKINYEKAAKMFSATLDAINYLTAQMQYFALIEFFAETAVNVNAKFKHLQHCLQILLDIAEMMQAIAEKNVDIPAKDVEEFDSKCSPEEFKTGGSLIILVKQRLQRLLQGLTKICLQKPAIHGNVIKYLNLYKKCYAVSFDIDKEVTFYAFARTLHNVLETIACEIAKETQC